MKRRVMVKFHGKEIEALDKFARDVGLQPADLVKKCVWKCLKEAYTAESTVEVGVLNDGNGSREGVIDPVKD